MKRCFQAALAAAAILTPAGARAQVGHDPATSPYRDLRSKQVLGVMAGYLWGSRGVAGVGPSGGQLVTARYDRSVGGPMNLFLGLGFANANAYRMDPNLPASTRRSGPFNQGLVVMDAGLHLLLTGRKTWRGFAPYGGVGFGVVFQTGLPDDLSGYSFGTKAHLGPQVGIRWYPVEALSLRLEARDLLWRLKYPTQFFSPPPVFPNEPPVLEPATDPSAQWTHHPVIAFGIGYTFFR